MYSFRGLVSPLPDSETIAAVQREIEHFSREEYEPWRFAISERFRQSGALESICRGVMDWATQKATDGADAREIGLAVSSGLALCAFQLGYLVALASTKADARVPPNGQVD